MKLIRKKNASIFTIHIFFLNRLSHNNFYKQTHHRVEPRVAIGMGGLKVLDSVCPSNQARSEFAKSGMVCRNWMTHKLYNS